ncbi:MAG: hypothetical protein R2698_01790 [Microthrixaceae bacterium]
MATPSSTSKKVKRVQQSGVTRRAGQRRPLAFPAAVTVIVIVGLLLVWWARDNRVHAGGDKPRANRDTWYEAFGVYQCDDYLANLAAPKNPGPISTKGNGVIMVAPDSDDTAGDNATLGKFFSNSGIKVTDTSVRLPDGTTLKAGDTCGAGSKKTTKTVLRMFAWPPQSAEDTKAEIVDEDFGEVRFAQDKSVYALALVPEGTKKIPLPGSSQILDTPDVGATPASTEAPTTEPPTTTLASTEAPTTSPQSTAPASTGAPTTAAPTVAPSTAASTNR